MRTTVGIFDSGVGGLTVAAALHRLLPALPIHYVADSAYFPYGERSAEEVEARSRALTQRLVDEGCNLVVVACNTASSAALERLRAEFAVPIVGMEPPLKPAVERSKTKRVAVLATPGTVSGERLARLRDAHGGDVEVVMLAMPGLADLVEDGEVDGERVESMLRGALDAAGADVDELALGCTHYGFLRPALEAMVSGRIEVIDAAEPVARRVEHQLREYGLEIPAGDAMPVRADATGDIAVFVRTVERLRAASAALPPIEFAQHAQEATA
ncbi:MAG: glutamate racemase [Chloroflexi bacterium]|nr:MAG: glutamate racemase [Chloroflexota bacterium]